MRRWSKPGKLASRRIRRALVCLLPALLVGAIEADAARAQSGGDAAASPALAAAGAAQKVRVAAARDAFVHPRREAPAGVVARNESRISAEVAAVVREIGADVGEVVRKGALLVRLDDADLRLALERAVAQRASLVARMNLARRQLDRARELQRQNFVSIEAVNQREAELLAQQADLRAVQTQIATARNALAKTVIRAPFEGVVSQRSAQLGELSSPGAPLLVLTQTGAPEIRSPVPAADAGWLALAETIVFDAGDAQLPVRLLRVSPVAARESRTREARLAFVESPRPPGSEGTLRWSDPRPHLPAALLVRRAGTLGVFAVADGVARFVAVPGAQEGRPAFTRLPGDTRLVVDGQARLRDGDRVVE